MGFRPLAPIRDGRRDRLTTRAIFCGPSGEPWGDDSGRFGPPGPSPNDAMMTLDDAVGCASRDAPGSRAGHRIARCRRGAVARRRNTFGAHLRTGSDPETVSGSRGFTPPAWRNHRNPTGDGTPAPLAASSVIAPAATAAPTPVLPPSHRRLSRRGNLTPDSHEPPTAASRTPSHTSEISRVVSTS